MAWPGNINPLSQAATQPATRPAAPWEKCFDALQPSIHETSWRNWGILFGLIVAGLLLGQVLSKVLEGLCSRQRKLGRPIRAAVFEAASGPMALFCLVAGVGIGGGGIAMSPEVYEASKRLLLFLNVVVAAWYLFNAIDVIDLVLRRHISGRGHTTFVQAVPLVRRSLRLFLIIVVALFTVENVFGGDVSSWLAGLGIAGLAVTLSAQDSLKNFFGSITILLDRPFQIGDYIVIDGYEGTVEEVGFRSTRLRRNVGSIVTIPNSKATEQSISNFSRRDGIRRTVDVLLPYDTPIEKLRTLPDRVCAILAAADVHEKLSNRYPPQVRFVEQKPDNLSFRIIYWFESTDRHSFYKHAQHVNLELLEYFRAEELNAKLSDVDVMVGKR